MGCPVKRAGLLQVVPCNTLQLAASLYLKLNDYGNVVLCCEIFKNSNSNYSNMGSEDRGCCDKCAKCFIMMINIVILVSNLLYAVIVK